MSVKLVSESRAVCGKHNHVVCWLLKLVLQRAVGEFGTTDSKSLECYKQSTMSHSGGTVEDQRAWKDVDSGGPAGEVSAGNLVRGCSYDILSANLTESPRAL